MFFSDEIGKLLRPEVPYEPKRTKRYKGPIKGLNRHKRPKGPNKGPKVPKGFKNNQKCLKGLSGLKARNNLKNLTGLKSPQITQEPNA